MAAFAYTHTSKLRKAINLGDGIGVFYGSVTISNYNSTNAAIAEITGKFKSLHRVVATSESSNGYRASWNGTSSFKCWRSLTAAADAQAPDDTNIGSFDYVAFGLV